MATTADIASAKAANVTLAKTALAIVVTVETAVDAETVATVAGVSAKLVTVTLAKTALAIVVTVETVATKSLKKKLFSFL